MDLLAELEETLSGKSEEQLTAIRDKTRQAIGTRKWIPNPGPQTDAYFSKAFITLYGGQAGGGKSDLELGLGV